MPKFLEKFGLYFLLLIFFISYLVYIFIFYKRHIPTEIDDSIIYIFKTYQIPNCFLQDCTLLNELKSQFINEREISLNKHEVWQREFYKLTYFHIFNVGYTFIHHIFNIFINDLFISFKVMKSFFILSIPVMLFYFQKTIFTNFRQSIIFIFLIIFYSFSEQGLHSVTATSLCYIFTLIFISYYSKINVTNKFAFFSTLFFFSIHDYALVCYFLIFMYRCFLILKFKEALKLNTYLGLIKSFNRYDYILILLSLFIFFFILRLSSPEFKTTSDLYVDKSFFEIVKGNIRYIFYYLKDNLFYFVSIPVLYFFNFQNLKNKKIIIPFFLSIFFLQFISIFHYGGMYHHSILILRNTFFVEISYFIFLSFVISSFLYKNKFITILVFILLSLNLFENFKKYFYGNSYLLLKENLDMDSLNELSNNINFHDNDILFYNVDDSPLNYILPLSFFSKNIVGNKNTIHYLCKFYDNNCNLTDYDLIIHPSNKSLLLSNLKSLSFEENYTIIFYDSSNNPIGKKNFVYNNKFLYDLTFQESNSLKDIKELLNEADYFKLMNNLDEVEFFYQKFKNELFYEALKNDLLIIYSKQS